MRTTLLCGFVSAMLACAGTAFAYPTLMGPTGLAVLPTANVSSNTVTVAADYQKLDGGQTYPLRALVAVGSRVEVGGEYSKFTGNSAMNNGWDLNAKVRLLHLLFGETAIGAIYSREVNTANATTNFGQGYFVWTAGFNAPKIAGLHVTLGANYTQAEGDKGVSISPNSTNNAIRGFAGVDVKIIDALDLIGEYQTKNSDLGDVDPIIAITVRYKLLRDLAIQVGTSNALDMHGTGHQEIFAGLTTGI